MQAFFVRVAGSLSADSSPAALIPFVSLTLSYLSRHSTKAYYALSTPLLGNLITTALTTPSAAVVSLALRSLAIFVVTLPVVVGEYLFGIMAVYGRAVSWEMAHDHVAGESGDPVEGRGGEGELPRSPRHTLSRVSACQTDPRSGVRSRGRGTRRTATRPDDALYDPIRHLPLQLYRLPEGTGALPAREGLEGRDGRREDRPRVGDRPVQERGEPYSSELITPLLAWN